MKPNTKKYEKILDKWIKDAPKGEDRNQVKELILNVYENGGDLELSNYPQLTSLPNELSISGNVSLTECINLKELPKKMTIEGNLNLNGCNNITSIPKDISISGDLNIANCKNIKDISLWIKNAIKSKNKRKVTLVNTGMSDKTINELIKLVKNSSIEIIALNQSDGSLNIDSTDRQNNDDKSSSNSNEQKEFTELFNNLLKSLSKKVQDKK